MLPNSRAICTRVFGRALERLHRKAWTSLEGKASWNTFCAPSHDCRWPLFPTTSLNLIASSSKGISSSPWTLWISVSWTRRSARNLPKRLPMVAQWKFRSRKSTCSYKLTWLDLENNAIVPQIADILFWQGAHSPTNLIIPCAPPALPRTTFRTAELSTLCYPYLECWASFKHYRTTSGNRGACAWTRDCGTRLGKERANDGARSARSEYRGSRNRHGNEKLMKRG